MATIVFTKGNSDVETFYKSGVENPQQYVDELNAEEAERYPGEQYTFFGFYSKDMKEHEFYGYSSKEEMMENLLS